MAIDEGNHSGARTSNSPKKPFYRTLWGQVLIGVAIGIVLGYLRPHAGVAMKPLGDAFIRLITMVITLVVFCTIVYGHCRHGGHEEGWPGWRKGSALF